MSSSLRTLAGLAVREEAGVLEELVVLPAQIY